MDQAARLRELARHHQSCVIAVLSGKGGVGKTNIALSLSILARRNMSKVLLWDADFGLANCDVLLDLAPKYTVLDCLRKKVPLGDAVLRGPEGIHVLPGTSGVREPLELGPEGRKGLRELYDDVRSQFELVVIDNAAGIGENVISLALWADSILLTTTPEVPAVADAYATLKVLCQAGRTKGIRLLVNMAGGPAEAEKIGGRIRHVAERFLGITVDLVGWLPADPQVPRAVSVRKPFVLFSPTSPAASALGTVWDRIGPAVPAVCGGAQ